MKYIKCIKDLSLLTAGKWYGINQLNFYDSIVTVFRPSDNDWVMSDKENFDMGFLLDNPPDFKMKEFQNKQHERLHNALIGAGFTNCGGKNLPNDTVSWNYGYINKQLDEYIYFDYCTDECILIRNISDDSETTLSGDIVADIITHYESLAPTQPITKDNIAEVLKFNNITDISVHANSLGKKHCFSLSMKPDNWLDIFEAIIGKKLKSLPKIPEFNFEQYLLDNGFKKTTGVYDVIFSVSHHLSIYKSGSTPAGEWSCGGVVIQENLQNADILITMANLAKDLK